MSESIIERLAKMEPEELVAQFEDEHHDYLDGRPSEVDRTRAELLKRLRPTASEQEKEPRPEGIEDVALFLGHWVAAEAHEADCGCNVCRASRIADRICGRPEAATPSPEAPPRQMLTNARIIGGKLAMNLNDAATLSPERFNVEGVKQLIAEWNEIVKAIVTLEMATPVKGS